MPFFSRPRGKHTRSLRSCSSGCVLPVPCRCGMVTTAEVFGSGFDWGLSGFEVIALAMVFATVTGMLIGCYAGYFTGRWVERLPLRHNKKNIFVSSGRSEVYHLGSCSSFDADKESRKLRCCKFCIQKYKLLIDKES